MSAEEISPIESDDNVIVPNLHSAAPQLVRAIIHGVPTTVLRSSLREEWVDVVAARCPTCDSDDKRYRYGTPCYDEWHAPYGLNKEEEISLEVPVDLLEALVEEEDCDFDHHGGCQAHGYLTLTTEETCPQERLKGILKDYTEGTDG